MYNISQASGKILEFLIIFPGFGGSPLDAISRKTKGKVVTYTINE